MTSSSGNGTADDSQSTSIAYNIVACVIFAMVSYCFFLPCNNFIPLDRRSASILGATLCYATRSFLFPHNKMDLVDAIDFDVLVLLGGIMAINFIMVHQYETKCVIRYVQRCIQKNPVRGFWLVSVAAFIVSPFLTNDGVCLLFVEPILNAFESLRPSNFKTSYSKSLPALQLMKPDALYFLLTLACSSNIGSSLTYTGNPQNMIVAGDSISVLSPLRFLGYMLLPSTLSFLVTTLWIQRIWLRSRLSESFSPIHPVLHVKDNDGLVVEAASEELEMQKCDFANRCRSRKLESLLSPLPATAIVHSPDQYRTVDEYIPLAKKVVKILVVPFPYAMLLIMGIMVALIFVDLVSMSGLICMTACVMVVTLVLGNHYRGKNIWGKLNSSRSQFNMQNEAVVVVSTSDGSDHYCHKANIECMNKFFEELFDSIDYNLLLIFSGLFVVVENLDSTGIPRLMWSRIVGKTPFDTIASVSGISIFVVVASQFLGNVAVCQLIKPNVEILDDDARRYAWAVISFVATIGGNLTVPGSAANIIVAEKAVRIDSSASITFFNHFAVCFTITLFCCCLGGVLITGIVICDNGMMRVW